MIQFHGFFGGIFSDRKMFSFLNFVKMIIFFKFQEFFRLDILLYFCEIKNNRFHEILGLYFVRPNIPAHSALYLDGM